ncbi:MAG TPA: PLP-dependent transferase, partial [Thermoanaerobaculia bacterium]|nr:PLP-dependent transferase [Thermoanaerobaculia bacterium]
QQPFRLGADFVVQSLTKYVNGHSTSIAGSVLGPFPFMSGEFFAMAKDLGPTPSPMDSWLNSLCIQTLPQRMDEAVINAEQLALWLSRHPRVARVNYPGLADHPQNHLVGTQMRNGGAMIAFELEGGFDPAVRLMNYFARHQTPMELAVSLGSVISYIEHPASMTHAVVPQADRLARGITDGLIRLSVGLEGTSVIRRAFEEGLRVAFEETGEAEPLGPEIELLTPVGANPW